jgi:hypothetical protein
MPSIRVPKRIVITNEEQAIELTDELNRLNDGTPDLYFIGSFLLYLERILSIKSALKDWEVQKRILAQA